MDGQELLEQLDPDELPQLELLEQLELLPPQLLLEDPQLDPEDPQLDPEEQLLLEDPQPEPPDPQLEPPDPLDPPPSDPAHHTTGIISAGDPQAVSEPLERVECPDPAEPPGRIRACAAASRVSRAAGRSSPRRYGSRSPPSPNSEVCTYGL